MNQPIPHSRPAYRIGIDVGGTFTKAALVDGRTGAIVARSSVHTTHAHERGVAAGVIAAFRSVLRDSGVKPEHIVFLAHSTTQATNALLECDVADVGVLGVAPDRIAALAKEQTHIAPIELSEGKWLPTSNRFLIAETIDAAAVSEAIAALKADGARVIVASAAFGVDDTSTEDLIRDTARAAHLATTCGHDITRLYGLAKRTKTAVINASILPKMIATADMTEASVREAGIAAPLMIMRGDGGVMDIEEMRRRPALTMLSGPAASMAGALMHVGLSDGIYFEVGGTSTNIGVVRDGRPSVAYARVGGHETYVNSLDIRVLGVAGGSLVRLEGSHIIDVGPRSAHIAGLAYACFADAAFFSGGRVVLVEPRPGDGAAFVAIETVSGDRYAITTTCAANALGLIDEGVHAFAGPDAARAAIRVLADHLGSSVETVATRILDIAADKIEPVLHSLAVDYKLDPDQQTLIGVGGGVGSVLRHIANRTGHRTVVPKDAEIISSIGAALAMVREVVERIISNPVPEDLVAIRREAIAAAMRLGADADAIDVTIEIDKATSRVRAVATGAAEMRTRDGSDRLEESAARAIAAEAMGVTPDAALIRAEIPAMRAFSTTLRGRGPLRVIDHTGHIRIQRSSAEAETVTAGTVIERMRAVMPEGEAFGGGFVAYHGHIIDLASLEDCEQAIALVASELANVPARTPVLLVSLPAKDLAVAVPTDP